MKSERALSLGKNDDGVNWQYMRLADVYLMAAEAINALDNDQQTAWNYMKPVLDRALPAAKVEALKTKYTANQEAFFNGIVEQRAFEFAGEMLRKADSYVGESSMRRWQRLSRSLQIFLTAQVAMQTFLLSFTSRTKAKIS